MCPDHWAGCGGVLWVYTSAEFDFTGTGWGEISYGPKSLRMDGVAYPAPSCVLTGANNPIKALPNPA